MRRRWNIESDKQSHETKRKKNDESCKHAHSFRCVFALRTRYMSSTITHISFFVICCCFFLFQKYYPVILCCKFVFSSKTDNISFIHSEMRWKINASISKLFVKWDELIRIYSNEKNSQRGRLSTRLHKHTHTRFSRNHCTNPSIGWLLNECLCYGISDMKNIKSNKNLPSINQNCLFRSIARARMCVSVQDIRPYGPTSQV